MSIYDSVGTTGEGGGGRGGGGPKTKKKKLRPQNGCLGVGGSDLSLIFFSRAWIHPGPLLDWRVAALPRGGWIRIRDYGQLSILILFRDLPFGLPRGLAVQRRPLLVKAERQSALRSQFITRSDHPAGCTSWLS